MRLLTRCAGCRRQFDASRLMPGQRFRCSCGEVVTVQVPRGHEAKTIVCSSCGATREEEARACGHCGSDFTVHETDLDTVCPACQARISDRARYCHYCGAAVVVETVAGDATEHACPACGDERKLTGRRLEGASLSVLECRVCAGLWIGIHSFHELLQSETRRGAVASPVDRPPPSRAAGGYRPCVVCGELMSRRNFGRTSGVIVDVCGQHGLWFDQDEISHLLAWIRGGGLQAARDDAARLVGSPDQARRQALAAKPPAEEKPRGGNDSAPLWSPDHGEEINLIGTVVRAILSGFLG